jgi:hypothetical protein
MHRLPVLQHVPIARRQLTKQNNAKKPEQLLQHMPLKLFWLSYAGDDKCAQQSD